MKDYYGDRFDVVTTNSGEGIPDVWLDMELGAAGNQTLALTTKKARKLAKKLIEAADVVDGRAA